MHDSSSFLRGRPVLLENIILDFRRIRKHDRLQFVHLNLDTSPSMPKQDKRSLHVIPAVDWKMHGRMCLIQGEGRSAVEG